MRVHTELWVSVREPAYCINALNSTPNSATAHPNPPLTVQSKLRVPRPRLGRLYQGL